MITTPRTIQRPMEPSDAAALFSWRRDPGVMRFTPGPDADIAATMTRIEFATATEARFGFSRWLVLDRVTGEPIGDAGLLPMPDSEDFELGYRLRRDRWGQGLATEIAVSWVNHARNHLRLPHLVAFTHRDHAVSQRVLEKASFRRNGEAIVHGMPCLLYRLDFRAQQTAAITAATP